MPRWSFQHKLRLTYEINRPRSIKMQLAEDVQKPDSIGYTFQCKACGITFPDLDSLKVHRAAHFPRPLARRKRRTRKRLLSLYEDQEASCTFECCPEYCFCGDCSERCTA